MKKTLSFLLAVLLMAGMSLTAHATMVTVKYVYRSPFSFVNKETGESVDIGMMTPDFTLEFECEPGTYIFSARNAFNKKETEMLSLECEVLPEENYGPDGMVLEVGLVYDVLTNTTTDGDSGERHLDLGEDFTIENLRVEFPDGKQREVVPGAYIESAAEPVNFGYVALLPKGTKLTCDFVPTEKWPLLATATSQITCQGSPSGYNKGFGVKMKTLEGFTFRYPANAKGEISYKGARHYMPFTAVMPATSVTEGDITTATYALDKNTEYCYRVSREGCMTIANTFKPTQTSEITVSEEWLSSHSNRYFDHDIAGRGACYADIYLNINRRGLLRMTKDSEFQIVNLRTWQLTNSITGNYFVEPDFNWTVLNEDFQPDNTVIEVDDNGRITAKKAGTAIVQVRYDAMATSIPYGSLWSEIWAENTGTFVVTVDAEEDKWLNDNISLPYKPETPLDSEHDILYYMAGAPGYYLTFTPTEGATVAVANPVVDTEKNDVAYPDAFSDKNVTVNADGSVTVLLTFGRNIIQTSLGGKSTYQVLSAKPVTMDVVYPRDDKYILPGDKVGLQFHGLFHVSGKLAGIYNNNCHMCFNGVVKDKGVLLFKGQYDFAGNDEVQCFESVIPADATDKYAFENGCLNAEGYGDGPGGHRRVTYDDGVRPNVDAGVGVGFFGHIPSQYVPVTPLTEVDRLKVSLSLGESVVPVAPEVVTAAYGDDAVWSCADSRTVQTDAATGKIVALKAGETTVTLTDKEGKTLLTCDVTVNDNPDYVAVTGIYVEGDGEGDVKEKVIHMNEVWGNFSNSFKAHVLPENATIQTINWVSDDPHVCIGQPGKTSHVSTGAAIDIYWNSDNEPGEAIVTGTTLDGEYAGKLRVVWMRGSDGITLDKDNVTVEQYEQTTLCATPTTANCSYKPIWTSSDEAVATVDEDGNVRGVSVGEAIVTAKVPGRQYASNYVSATCRVNVSENSGVENVTAERQTEGYYNLQGVRSERPWKGINMVRYTDGTVRKVTY